MDISPGKLLDIHAVARALDIHERTVRRYVQQGRLSKPRRHGRSQRWFEADVAVYFWRLSRGDFEGLETIEDEDPWEDDPPGKSSK